MAGISIVCGDANFSSLLTQEALPITSGKVGEYALGGSLNKSSVNKAGGSNLLSVGSPTINQYSALLSQGNHFNTQLTPTLDSTIIVVAKRPAAGAIFVGNMDTQESATLNGDNLQYTFPGGNSTHLTGSSNGTLGAVGVAINLAAIDTTNFRMFAYRVLRSTADQQTVSAYLTANTLTNGGPNPTGKQSAPAFASFRIGNGSKNNSSYAGSTEIAYVAVYNRILTDAELNSNYAFLKNYFSGKISMI